MHYIPSEIIKNKKRGLENTPEELTWLIESFVDGSLADYQMSAWAMAVWFKGMTENETATFTKAMLNSGTRFQFAHLKSPRIDKHSSGGVGDKTSLIIGPILAAAKVHLPMIAGRGLGHTGGTLDKLESLAGFRIQLSKNEFQSLVEKKYFALISQTEDICPADRKLYALRDVTSTVDSLPLICGSIMSKKLAEDLTGLVLDIKFGSGAFMKTVDEAIALASLLKTTGEKNGLKVTAVLSNMNQPLGRFIGNALEVRECYEILSGQSFLDGSVDYYEPTRHLSLLLSGHMLFLAGKVSDPEAGFVRAQELLASGQALACFKDLLIYQGPTSIDTLRVSPLVYEYKSRRGGFANSINTELVGLASIELGAGRKTAADTIDHSTGIEMCFQLGQTIKEGQTLMKIYYSKEEDLKGALKIIDSAIEISAVDKKDLLPLVAKVLI